MATRLYQDEQDKYHLIGRPENPHSRGIYRELQKGEVSIELTPELCAKFGLDRRRVITRPDLSDAIRTIEVPDDVPEIPTRPQPEVPMHPKPEIPLYPKPKTPGLDFEA